MKRGFAVIRDMTITGTLEITLSLIDKVKMLSENGAKAITIPIEQFSAISSSVNLLENIMPIPISSPENAFLKGRLEE